MAFFDLFTQVAGSYPADQFFQVVFNTDETGAIGAGITLTIGPRDDHTQLKQYTIADKEAFATAVQDEMTAGTAALDAFAANLPAADETVTQGQVVAVPPVVAAPVETPAEAPAETLADTTTTETTDATTTDTPAETPAADATTDTTTTESEVPAADTTTQEAPQDQS